MKKIYIEPTLRIENFHVDDIITLSVMDVLQEGGVNIEELGEINFNEGNTLESIDYGQFLK